MVGADSICPRLVNSSSRGGFHAAGSWDDLQGLGTVRTLYIRISLVFQNEFSSNGRAGLMLLLSHFVIGHKLVCTQ